MIVALTVDELRKALVAWRKNGDRIVFVPTMGNLHKGHLQLVRVAKQIGQKVIVSVYVNPMQFDRDDDFDKYPRTLRQDMELLESAAVDLVFAPSDVVMYPRPLAEMTFVEVPGLGDTLEGASRPGHFRGVTTVVARLLSLVAPDVAVFGKKDYQQLLLIRHMVDDLGMPIEIVGEPTVREPDGLALSSRNSTLTPEERTLAPRLHETLEACCSQILQGQVAIADIEAEAVQELERAGFAPDYVKIRRQSDLAVADESAGDLVVLAAAWLGKTRLIDNVELSLNQTA